MHSKDNHRVRSGSTASASTAMSPQSTPDSSPQRDQQLSDGDDVSLSEDEVDDEDDIVPSSSWTFFQPFVGGIKFVLLQILSWYVSRIFYVSSVHVRYICIPLIYQISHLTCLLSFTFITPKVFLWI